MAFIKDQAPEDVEVKVMTSEEAPKQGVKLWERNFAKHVQSEIRLERFFQDD